MLYGIVVNAFSIYTDKLVTIKEGTKVCMECTNGLTGEWSVENAENHWTMNSDRMRQNIKVVSK